SRRRHTRFSRDWSSDVCSSDLGDTNLWIAVAFVAFLLILFKLGAHRAISGGLDRRAERIRTELDEARQLREEAHKLLVEYQRKRSEGRRVGKSVDRGRVRSRKG